MAIYGAFKLTKGISLPLLPTLVNPGDSRMKASERAIKIELLRFKPIWWLNLGLDRILPSTPEHV